MKFKFKKYIRLTTPRSMILWGLLFLPLFIPDIIFSGQRDISLLGCQNDLIDSLNRKGLEQSKVGNYYEAFNSHREALSLSISLRDEYCIAQSLSLITQTEIQINSHDSADVHAQKLLEIARSISDSKHESDALRFLGEIHFKRSEYKEAENKYLEALQIAENIKDRLGIAMINHGLANVYADMAEFERAINHYLISLKINQDLENTPNIGKSLYDIGLTHLLIGNYDAAIGYFDSAKIIFKEIGDRTQLGITLIYIGTLYSQRADYQTAVNHIEEGLQFSKEMRDTFSIAVAYGSLGDIFLNCGEYTKAVRNHQKASIIFNNIGNLYNLSASFVNLGACYHQLCDYEKAIMYYQKAISLKEEIGEQYGIGITLGNIGYIYLEQNNVEEALNYYKRSLEIANKIGDKPTVGRAYENIGIAYSRLGKNKDAEENLDYAHRIFKELQMRAEEAGTLISIGELNIQHDNFIDASKCFDTALDIGKEIRKPEILWRAYTGKGLVSEQNHKLSEAINNYRFALDAVEKVRSEISITEYRAGFLASKYSPYESIIRVLGRMHLIHPTDGYERQAFEIAERSKARSFVELLTESRANIQHGLTEEQKYREVQILQNISKFQSKMISAKLTEDEKREISDNIQKEEENLEHFRSEIRQTNPIYADLKYPDPIDISTLQQSILNEGELLLEFKLCKNNSYLWLISKDSVMMFRLPSESKIEQQVKYLITELHTRPNKKNINSSLNKIHKLGGSLFTTLLNDARKAIASAKHLIIVPDGILFYLPFEVLRLPAHLSNRGEYLFEKVPISYAQSATVFAQLRNRSVKIDNAQYDLLAFGDPSFHSYSKSEIDTLQAAEILVRSLEEIGNRIDPLPSSKIEVDQIASLFDGRAKCYLGENANENQVKSEPLQLYKYIHFATHGFINEKKPSRSGILLSAGKDAEEDGLLQMNEIFNLEMNADIVVLSACETGLGKLLKGEGMVGLTRAFHFAGAKSLVVSLWKVADASTAEFMKSFYENITKGNNPSQALQHAKVQMLNKNIKLWTHPFHWAGFVIQGEGR